ncbi:hypothetical protein [Lentilactobacillus sp. Marseille-Q4993]|uniref:hypothetical protein n=1 Tax=Lentilactobacillus sp. Marseille-Q4993 TaxID=3039492 RepID=UPI0024BC2FD5|nr:hypothetical protein [Lentilactobacillus sp. Marseille-Q4993]
MKLNRIAVIAGLALGGVTYVSTQQQVDAAGWHKGTPKVLRHHYTSKRHGISYYTTIGKAGFDDGGPGDGLHLKNVKYKKVGKHSYIFSGIEYFYSHKRYHIKVVGNSHKVTSRETYPYNNKYWSGWDYR